MTETPELGIPALELRPGQIMTFGDTSRLFRQFKWRRVLGIRIRGENVVVLTLWHFPKTVPANSRVWLWQS